MNITPRIKYLIHQIEALVALTVSSSTSASKYLLNPSI